MKKYIPILLIIFLLPVFIAIITDITEEKPYVVNTYEATPQEENIKLFEESQVVILETHYEMSDGTWKTAKNKSYKYRLELRVEEMNATLICLTNNKNLSPRQAYKEMMDKNDPSFGTNSKLVGFHK
ncbi:MAG: hypothetical protein E7406_08185 [Ruminococcaceae bacterium]|nr:hypothetical protein [Oscillospiraceae bacterium]